MPEHQSEVEEPLRVLEKDAVLLQPQVPDLAAFSTSWSLSDQSEQETYYSRPFDAVVMKKILLIAFCLLSIAGPAAAYGLYLDCPSSVQVGLPLKCSIDSDLPAGWTFDLVLYRSQYTATELSRQTVTIQQDHNTQYRLFETQGLPGGTYKVEAQVKSTGGEESLRSDSVTYKLVTVLDRSGEITITSPARQELEDALRIEGSIEHLGSEGVQIEVRGPEGRIFGPQYIGTTTDVKNNAGEFTYKVAVSGPGTYEVSFSDPKGFIGIKTFDVITPATPVPTTAPTTMPRVTTRPPTTMPTPLPTTTQSPLPLPVILGALGVAGLLMAREARRK